MTWGTLQILMGSDAWMVSLTGLVAFEGGLILWPSYFMKAETETQRGIAAVMALIDLFGVGAAFILGVMHNNPGMKGIIPQFMDVALVGVPLVILVNIAAYIVVEALDPNKQIEREMASLERAQKMVRLSVMRQSVHATLSVAQETANQIVPGLAAQNLRDVLGSFRLDGVNIEAPKAPAALLDSGTSPKVGKQPSTPKPL